MEPRPLGYAPPENVCALIFLVVSRVSFKFFFGGGGGRELDFLA